MQQNKLKNNLFLYMCLLNNALEKKTNHITVMKTPISAALSAKWFHISSQWKRIKAQVS